MLVSLAPKTIDDIMAAIALYRPGPMESIPKFIECRNHPEKVQYAAPALEPILRSTHGCIVYQEQVMSIFRVLAGYTLGHADIVRRAMSKKKADVLLSERETFVNGAMERGVERDVAAELFADIESFANYAFNQSHAAAYAVISYRTAYLKCHYPHAYFSALLTSVLGSQTKVAEYIAECSSRGIRVLPPDINESRMLFSVSGKNIRFGLLAVKNVGKQFLGQILEERRHGKFTSFADFIGRMPPNDLNKRMVESLLKAGTFDGLGVYRSRLLRVYEEMIDRAAERGRNNLVGQLDMFSLPGTATQAPDCEYPEIPEFGVREKLLMEKEATGMYFSGQMLDEYSKHVALFDPDPISDYVGEEADPAEKARASVAGIITSVVVKNTRNGQRMAFFTLEDRMAEMECVVFAKLFAENAHLIRTDGAVWVSGTISLREDEPPKLLVNRMEELVEDRRFRPEAFKAPATNAKAQPQPKQEKNAPAQLSQETVQAREGKKPESAPRRLFLRVPSQRDRLYLKALNLTELFDGNFPAYFYFADEKRYEVEAHGIYMDDYILSQLRQLLGEENVILK